MFTSLAVLAFAAGSALAQGSSSSSAPASSSTGSPLIPTGISSGCNAFLVKLNGNTELTKCFDALNTLTQGYGPGNTTVYSKAAVTSTLNSVCSDTTAAQCPPSVIRGQLADFYPACMDELVTNPKAEVVKIYEVLYALPAFKDAICTKGDDGNFCAIVNRGAANVVLTRSLEARAEALTPNTKAYGAANLPFLFIKPDMPKEALCTPCTRNILSAWFNVESQLPYAPGFDSQTVLSGQKPLVAAITSTCGSNFFAGSVAAAGGLGANTVFDAAVPRAGSGSHAVVAAVVAVFSFIATSAL